MKYLVQLLFLIVIVMLAIGNYGRHVYIFKKTKKQLSNDVVLNSDISCNRIKAIFRHLLRLF